MVTTGVVTRSASVPRRELMMSIAGDAQSHRTNTSHCMAAPRAARNCHGNCVCVRGIVSASAASYGSIQSASSSTVLAKGPLRARSGGFVALADKPPSMASASADASPPSSSVSSSSAERAAWVVSRHYPALIRPVLGASAPGCADAADRLQLHWPTARAWRRSGCGGHQLPGAQQE